LGGWRVSGLIRAAWWLFRVGCVVGCVSGLIRGGVRIKCDTGWGVLA